VTMNQKDTHVVLQH